MLGWGLAGGSWTDLLNLVPPERETEDPESWDLAMTFLEGADAVSPPLGYGILVAYGAWGLALSYYWFQRPGGRRI